MVLTWVLLSLFIYVTSYNLRCPATSEWSLTGKAMCNITDEYFCLYNNLEDHYVQGCEGPDWDRKGSKRIYAGYFTRAYCEEDRYQPFKFWTNGNSDCVYQKSLCNEEGQVIYSNGSNKEDRFCSCDFTSGYAFVVTPSNLCYCNLSALEDCSCYLKTCKEGYTLSADYECVENTSKPTICPRSITEISKDKPDRPILPNSSYVNRTEEVLDLDPYRQNKLYASYGIAIVVCLIIVCTILTLRFRQLINRYVSLCNNQIVQPLQKCLSNDFMRSSCCRKKDNYDVLDSGLPSIPPNIQSNEEDSSELRGIFPMEEVYALRIIYLVFRVANPILRIKFNKRVPPDKLKQCSYQLQQMYQRKEISPIEWKALVPPPKDGTATSFDIKIMVKVLKTLLRMKSINSSNDEADWYMIEKYQQDIKKDSNMKITVQTFQERWDEISEAILSLVADELPHIESEVTANNPEFEQLRDRISSLNLVPFGSKQLYKVVKLSDEYSARILQQIIKEYCASRGVSFSNLIKDDEKHELYHRRKRTLACCICDDSSCPVFVKAIQEKHWRQLFDTTGKKCTKCERDEKTCEKMFQYKSTLTLDTCDTSLATCFILNLPDLSKYTFKQMCVDGIPKFLNRHKHQLYHAMVENRCCQCFPMPKFVNKLNKREWKKLFSTGKVNHCSQSCDVGCSLKCFASDPQCENSECCCKYTARCRASWIKDSHLVSKIINIVGPISSINDEREREDLFNRFRNGNLNDEYLQQKCKTLQCDLNQLLNMTSSEEFKTDIREKILTSTIGEDDGNVSAGLHAWASSHLNDNPDQTSNTSRSLLPILIKNEGGFKVYKVNSRKEFSFSRKRELKDVSQEEVNFLRIFHLILKVACPAVRKKFDLLFPPEDMKNMILDWASEFSSDDETKKSKKLKKRMLGLNEQQRDMLNSPTSKDFNLEFMGYILKAKKITEAKMLQELLDICHKILHSCDGVLSDAQFENYWGGICEKSVGIGGEEFRSLCKELKKSCNIPRL